VNKVYEKGKSVSSLDKVRVKIVSYNDNSELYNEEFKLSGYEGEVFDNVNLPLIFTSCSIFVEAYDSSGNVGKESFDFYIQGAPVFYVSISSPVPSFAWFITNVSHFALSGNVNISTSYYGDISNIWVVLSNSTALYSNSIGNSQSFCFETNFGSLEENNWVYVYVLSTSNYWTNSWILYVYDTNKPFVLILDPTNNQTIAAHYDVVVSNYDKYGVVSNFLMVVDENNNTNIYTAYYSSYPFVYKVSFSNGTNEIIAYARDVVGNESYTNVIVIVDESIPWVVISNTSPVYVGVSNNVVTYGSSGVGGGSVITNIRLFVYTNSVIGYSTNVNFSSSDVTFSISHPVFMGTNVVGVVAYADNGKTSATNYYTVIADYMKPFVNFMLTNDEIVVTSNANNFNLVLEVGDTNYSLGGVVYIYVTNYLSGDGYYTSFWTNGGVWTNTTTITLLGGRNDISVFYVDNFGNSSSTNLTNVYCFDNAVYVATDGNDSNHGTIYDPLKSVQVGVNKAYSLGVLNVKVKQGNYIPNAGLGNTGVGVVVSNAISIIGGFNNDFSSISGFSTFDGQNALNHVIVITNTTNVIRLQNLRIIGGSNTSTTYPDNHGGGILIANVTNLINISNVFVYNNYSLFGGGIGVVNSSNRIVFVSPVAIYNNVSSNGGGIAFSQSTNNVIPTNTIHIVANNSLYGGGVSVIDSKVSLKGNVEVRYNSSQFGGGIYLTNSRNGEIDAQVYGNYATYGGGVYLIDSVSNVLKGITYSNYATNLGGGVYLTNSHGNTMEMTIFSNKSREGGGVYLVSSHSNILSNDVYYNEASPFYGGGVGLNNSSWNTIGGSIYSNFALTYGGGIYLNYSSSNTIGANVFGNKVSNEGGGGIYLGYSVGNTISSNVYGNFATNGGGICLWRSTNNTISANVFLNKANSAGGGVFSIDSTSNTIGGNVYSNSSGDGGGLYLTNSHTNTISCNVYANVATNYGGGILLSASYSNAVNGSVYSNVAFNGGGVYFEYSLNNLVSGGIYGNNASNSGGGIFFKLSLNNTISGSIYSNIANTNGGGIYLNYSHNNTINADVWYNKALGNGGGGIFLYCSTNNTISGSISNNSALWSGGGIGFVNSTNNIVNSTIFGNIAYQGGGIALSSSVSNKINGMVCNNFTTNYGGGLYLSSSRDNTINSIVCSNIAKDNGGGIYITGSSNFYISSNVSYNVSYYNGGGIALNLSSGILSNVYFTNNVSSNFGGAIYVGDGSGEIKLLNSVFFGNWSSNHGGAIYGVNTTNFTIKSNVFTNNYSSSTNTVITIASSISNLSEPFNDLKFITNVFSGYGSNSCAIWEEDLVVTNSSFDNDIKNHTIQGNIFYTNTFSYIYRDINTNATLGPGIPKAPGYIYSNSVDSLNNGLNYYHDANPSSGNVGY
jgi:predicted outer membrane repeat protein